MELYNQNIITTEDYYNTLKNIITKDESVFIVSSKSMTHNITNKISNITKNYVVFNDYQPNPSYEDIKKGKELFIQSKAKTIIAIGGCMMQQEEVAKKIADMSFDVVADFIAFVPSQLERDYRLFKGKTKHRFNRYACKWQNNHRKAISKISKRIHIIRH